MKTSARPHRWIAIIAAAAAPASAVAQGSPQVTREAENLYSQGAGAMIKKDYATACPKFEQVTRLVPEGGGVRLNLAQCYEAWGKLASAFRHYVVAGELAKKDGRKDRLQTATRAIERVKPSLAMLIVNVPDALRPAPDLAITLDGEGLSDKHWGTPYPVDRGAHTLVASATGYEPATVQVEIPKDGTTTTAGIPSLEAARARPAASASASSSAGSPPPVIVIVKEKGTFTPQVRTAAVIAGGALALGGIVAGGISLGLTFAKADEGRTASLNPYGEGAANAAGRVEAVTKSAALWCFVGGGVAAAGTAVFYLVTRPRTQAPVKAGAFVGPGGPSLWIEGQF